MIEQETLAGVVRDVAMAEDRAITPMVQKLRTKYPELLVSTCLDDEICGPDPVAQTPGINVYLISTSESGCQSLTRDPVAANGIVLAEVSEEEA